MVNLKILKVSPVFFLRNAFKCFIFIESMESVKKDLLNVKVKNLHQFGELQENVEEVHMKLFSDRETRFKRKYQLLCFNRAIIAIELENWTSKKIVKKYSQHFRMQGFKQKIKAPEKDERGRWIVELKSWGDGPDVDKEKSFYVKFSNKNEKKAIQFRDKMEAIRSNAHRRIEPSEEHKGHTFKKYVFEITKNLPTDHKKCGHCGDFLLGKLLRGIVCETCRSTYHEECFKSSNSGAAEEDAGHENIPDVHMINVTHERQFLSEDMSRQEVEDELKDKSPGSFLVRYSNRKNLYVVSKKTQTKVSHESIKQKTVKGVTYYWLQPGQGKTKILDVIKNHQLDRELYFPIGNSRPLSISNGANDNEDDDYEEDYVDSSSLRQSLSRDSEEDIHEVIPWEDYFHGDMDRQAATSQLKANSKLVV